MTRRIAIAILISVWAMLIAGGVVAYFTTRAIVLADLDASLMTRALTQAAQPVRSAATEPATVIIGADRYVIRDKLQRRIGLPTASLSRYEPKLLSANFSGAAGERLRTVTVRYYAIPAAAAAALGPPSAEPTELVTTFSDRADRFESLLDRLAWSLGMFGLVAGLVAAAVAVRVSKVALRPLARTAERIGSIDEARLDRRIDAAALPVELQPMAVRLNDMLGRLESAFGARNRFLADASHELRTPVAALVTSLEVALRQPRTADAYLRVLESCRGDAGLLRMLVERLMEQVRSQTLAHDEPAQTLDVAALLNECAERVAPLAEAKGVRLVRTFEPGMRCPLLPGRFRSVVVNLLSNAIEYNRPAGVVELRCSCNGDGLRLSVKDTGIGIAPEHLPHLFEPFYRIDKSRSGQGGHLGLGLSLVQSHVRAMSGTCAAESQPGVGTTFSVHLPEAQATPMERT